MKHVPTDAELHATGIVIVDHGSKRPQSNELLLAVAEQFGRTSGYVIVEPAHMELAEPSIATAFRRCVERGATRVVVHPYFLAPGRHWDQDIPRLVAEAARAFDNVPYLVTAPLGLHRLMLEVIGERIAWCLAHAEGTGPTCEICAGTDKCGFRLA